MPAKPHWRCTISNPAGQTIAQRHIALGPHTILFVEGSDNSDDWHFLSFFDDTQTRSQWVAQIVSTGGALSLEVEHDEVYVVPRSPHPSWKGDCSYRLPYTVGSDKTYVAFVRDGDVAEFREEGVRLSFDYVPDWKEVASFDIEVKSSRPTRNNREVQASLEEDVDMLGGDTDEDDAQDVVVARKIEHDDDTQQQIYSTSRERLSNTPKRRDCTESQIVHETPSKDRLRSVPHSLPHSISTIAYDTQDQPAKAVFNNNREYCDAQDSASTATRLNVEDHASSSSNTRNAPATGTAAVEHIEGSGEAVGHMMAGEAEEDAAEQVTEHDMNNSNMEAPEPAVEMQDVTHSSGDTKSPESSTEMASQPRGEPAEGQSSSSVASGAEAETEDAAAAETPAPPRSKRKLVTYSGSAAKRSRKATELEVLTKEATNILSQALADTLSGSPASRTRLATPHTTTSPPASAEAPRDIPTYQGPPLRILFPTSSPIPTRPDLLTFLSRHRATPAKSSAPAHFDILCVSPEEDPLKRTAKLLTSLVHGKLVATESWILASAEAKTLLDPTAFVPEALRRGVDDRARVFAGMTVCVTPKVRKAYGGNYEAIEKILRGAGASGVVMLGKSASVVARKEKNGESVYVGADEDDEVAEALQKRGVRVYRKDVIGSSIIAGRAEIDGPEHLLEGVGARERERSASSIGEDINVEAELKPEETAEVEMGREVEKEAVVAAAVAAAGAASEGGASTAPGKGRGGAKQRGRKKRK